MSKLREITDANITAVLNEKDITIISFKAEWCGPCRILGPILEDLSSVNNDVMIGKVNVDDNKEISLAYGIKSIPTTIFFKNGEIVNKIIGLKSKEEIQAKIEELKG